MSTHGAFRHQHVIKFLERWWKETTPLDVALNSLFRSNKNLGSHDRRYIAERVYGIVRNMNILDWVVKAEKQTPTWETLLKIYESKSWHKAWKDPSLLGHVRHSMPEDLFHRIVRDNGKAGAEKICEISNTTAPTTVRVNALKTTREAFMAKMKALKHEVSECSESPWGVVFKERINFAEMELFKAGHFEVQDEGSQIIANLVDVKPGQHVLDYCAGAGGKTLAFAPRMQNKGVIYLYDIRERALAEAKKRAKRAGISNIQFCSTDPKDSSLTRLKHRMDWVLVDVPCSGTGTLRRNPDIKWRFTPAILDNLVQTQRQIFDSALQFLKPGGRIVYVTCSLLKDENQWQTSYFLKQYSHLSLEGQPKVLGPVMNGMDAFYGACFRYSAPIATPLSEVA